MIEKKFIQTGANKASLEEFLDSALGRANYSHVDIMKTPVSTRLVIWSQKPGLVIGRGGSRIRELIEQLKEFGIENPQVEAEEVRNPNADARIVAKTISSWIERGGNSRSIGNVYLNRILEAGAVGAEICISGKVSGQRGRSEKYIKGYVKKCGKSAEVHVDRGEALAVLKLGTVGVRVKIMREMPNYMRKIILEKAEKEAKERAKASFVPEDVLTGSVTDVRERIVRMGFGAKHLEELLATENVNQKRKTLLMYMEKTLGSMRKDENKRKKSEGDKDGGSEKK